MEPVYGCIKEELREIGEGEIYLHGAVVWSMD